jgi:hypothetical protein
VIVDLYVSKRVISGPGGKKREILDLGYDPNQARQWTRYGWVVSLGACPNPTLKIEVPDDWDLTTEHGVTNLEFDGKWIDPRALYTIARSRGNKTRIVSGTDPFGPDTTAVEILTQPTFF